MNAMPAIFLFYWLVAPVLALDNDPTAFAQSEHAAVQREDATAATMGREGKAGVDAGSDILAVLPADTLFAVVVPDLSAFDDKLSELAKSLELTISPLLLMKGWLGMPSGLDDKGSASIAVIAPAAGQAFSRGSVLILPVVDRKALLAFHQPETIEAAYDKITLRGRETYVGTKGRFAVFGPDLATVRRVVEADKRLRTRLSDLRPALVDQNDLFFWLDTAFLASSPPEGPLDNWMRSRFGLSVSVLSLCSGLHGAIGMDAGGLSMECCGMLADAAPVANESTTTDSLLVGLPGEPFAIAMGLTNGAGGTRLQTHMNTMFAALAASGVLDAERSTELARAYRTVAAKITHVAGSVSLHEEQLEERLTAAKVLHTDGGARMLLGDIERVVRLLRAGPFVDARYNGIAERIEYRRAAETSGRVVIDHFYLDLGGFDRVDPEALRTLLGQEGLLTRIGAVDDNTVIAVLGGGLARFNNVLATVSAGEAPLARNEGIKESARRFTRGNSLEAYVAVDRCMRLVRQVSAVTGESIEFPEWPQVTSPVAVALHSSNPRETCAEAFVPFDVVAAFKDVSIASMVKQTGADRQDATVAPSKHGDPDE